MKDEVHRMRDIYMETSLSRAMDFFGKVSIAASESTDDPGGRVMTARPEAMADEPSALP